jgi:nitrogen fixation protein FixH
MILLATNIPTLNFMLNEKMNGEFMVEESTRKGLWHIPIIAMTADAIHATHYKLKQKIILIHF